MAVLAEHCATHPKDEQPENAARVLTALRQFGAPLLDQSEADLCAGDTVFQIGVPPPRIDRFGRF